MSRMEIINSMSEDDALLALQAARAICAGDIEKSTAAMEKMSTEGLNALVSVLEMSVERKTG